MPKTFPLFRQRPGRMTAWLVLGNVLVIGALVAMTVFSLRSQWESEETRASETADNLAQSLSIEVSAELRNADNALSTIALRFRSARLSREHEDSLMRILSEQESLLPQVDSLSITDIYGHVIAGDGAGEKPINVFDRPYFAQAMMSPDMVVSEPLQSRYDGQWCIVLARRLINHDGQFAGITFAVVSARHFMERFSGLALGPSGAVSLRTDSLNLIARYSASEPGTTRGFGARNLSTAMLQSLAANPDHGIYRSFVALDNVERLTAYRRVARYPVIVFTGISSQDYLAPWWRQVWQQSLLAALVALAVAGASWLIHRHQRTVQTHQAALARVAQQQQMMLQNDLIGMVRLQDGHAVWCNPALERMFGYGGGELQHHASRLLFLTDEDHLRVASVGSAAIRAGASYRVQLPMRRKDGSAFWVDVSGMVMSETESLWMLVDIDKLKRSEESAQQQATQDALTELPNRRMLEERLADTLLQSRRSGESFTLCYLDLDGFKPVNDRYGHDAGDEVLRQVAQRLQELVRNKDVVARMGGDEFAILLPGMGRAADAEQLLQRVLFSIQRRIQLDTGESVSVNASIGAVIGSGADLGRDLLRAADEVMYEAKRRGKGRIQVAQPAQPRAATEAAARDWAAAA